jgi:serine/threonine protein phosphatase PrpC
MKYHRVLIKTNNTNTNSNNINTDINNISSPSNKMNFYANLNKVRISHKAYGIIQAYATITSSGKRNYNEDRVSIIYNIPKPQGYIENKNTHWPNCSFFGLYDGHGGSAACDFLRDNLHKYIINDKYFPSNPQKAIANGFIYAEKIFFKNYTGLDSSGSCAIVVLIVENRVYIANVGDSRAILSAKNGTKFYPLSRDHRPGDEKEYKRILDAGGKIYKTEYEYGNNNVNSNSTRFNNNINNIINNNNRYNFNLNNNSNNKNQSNNNNNIRQNNTNNNITTSNFIKSPTINNKIMNNNYINSRYINNQNKALSPGVNINQSKISPYNNTPNNNNKITTINVKSSSVMGPLRVSPGKLSVSRTIGDIAAKDPKFGGNPNVIISIPEIKYFDNSDKNDFILIFCDGVYEKLKNKDIIDCLWKEISKKNFTDIHNLAGYTIEKLVNKCLEENSTDNLTVIMICLKNYEKLKLFEAPIPQTENIEQAKTKKLNITVNLRQKSQSKKPLSMLLTKMIHNNSQNIKKIINLKNNDNKEKNEKAKKNDNK